MSPFLCPKENDRLPRGIKSTDFWRGGNEQGPYILNSIKYPAVRKYYLTSTVTVGPRLKHDRLI
jgi:hypothetical protein